MPKEFETKTVDTINQDLINELTTQQSTIAPSKKKLTDFSQGSIIGTILRSIAVTIGNLWNELEMLVDGFYIHTATGDLLKKRLADFAFEVKEGSQASGSLLVVREPGVSFSLNVNIGEILLFGIYQFQVISPSDTSVFGNQSTSRTSKRLTVQSIDNSLEVNLPAGTALVPKNPTLRQLKFIVGTQIDSSGNVSGNSLSGGIPNESDEEARIRFQTYIQNLGKGTKNIIEAAVNNVPGVRTCKVYDNSRIVNNLIDGPETSNNLRTYPGYIVIQVQPNDIQSGLNLVESKIITAVEENKAAGIAYEIVQTPVKNIRLAVTVRTQNSSLSDSYKADLYTIIENRVNTLNVKEPLKLYALQSELYVFNPMIAVGGITIVAKNADGSLINTTTSGYVYPEQTGDGGILSLIDVDWIYEYVG